MHDDRVQLPLPDLAVGGFSSASPTTSVSTNGQSPPIPQITPLYYEPTPNPVFFRVENQQPPAQSFPASYLRPPSYSHPHTSIDRNLARQQHHGHRQSMAARNNQHNRGRPSHMRSSITARRWMIRINAIGNQQPDARSNNTTGRGRNISTNGTTSSNQQSRTQPPPYPPTNGPAPYSPMNGPDSRRREGDQQDDEVINRGMERAFQVLWGRGG